MMMREKRDYDDERKKMMMMREKRDYVNEREKRL